MNSKGVAQVPDLALCLLLNIFSTLARDQQKSILDKPERGKEWLLVYMWSPSFTLMLESLLQPFISFAYLLTKTPSCESHSESSCNSHLIATVIAHYIISEEISFFLSFFLPNNQLHSVRKLVQQKTISQHHLSLSGTHAYTISSLASILKGQ